MKQNIVYLFKGLLFSTLLMTALVFLLAFVMQQTQWQTSVMSPLLIVAYCLSTFTGSWYFSKHAEAKRFLWGIGFGAAFFVIYLIALFCITPVAAISMDRVLTFLAFGVIAGCVGGMLS